MKNPVLSGYQENQDTSKAQSSSTTRSMIPLQRSNSATVNFPPDPNTPPTLAPVVATPSPASRSNTQSYGKRKLSSSSSTSSHKSHSSGESQHVGTKKRARNEARLKALGTLRALVSIPAGSISVKSQDAAQHVEELRDEAVESSQSTSSEIVGMAMEPALENGETVAELDKRASESFAGPPSRILVNPQSDHDSDATSHTIQPLQDIIDSAPLPTLSLEPVPSESTALTSSPLRMCSFDPTLPADQIRLQPGDIWTSLRHLISAIQKTFASEGYECKILVRNDADRGGKSLTIGCSTVAVGERRTKGDCKGMVKVEAVRDETWEGEWRVKSSSLQHNHAAPMNSEISQDALSLEELFQEYSEKVEERKKVTEAKQKAKQRDWRTSKGKEHRRASFPTRATATHNYQSFNQRSPSVDNATSLPAQDHFPPLNNYHEHYTRSLSMTPSTLPDTPKTASISLRSPSASPPSLADLLQNLTSLNPSYMRDVENGEISEGEKKLLENFLDFWREAEAMKG